MPSDKSSVLTTRQPVAGGAWATLDRIALAVAERSLRHAAVGRLTLQLPSGAERTVGAGGGHEAHLRLNSYRPFWGSLRRGGLGFAESYLDGEAESSDLRELFHFFLDNREALVDVWKRSFRVRTGDRRYHALRRNTINGSRRNIADHYDLGNAFYALWLDQTLTYSSAIFADENASLEAAQGVKYDRVLRALNLTTGLTLLEIGCGWGEMAVRCARTGVSVTALTLSREQLAAVVDRRGRDGLDDAIDVRLEDYRVTGGQYDRVASIEMIEAVGEENWPRYFQVINDRLKPGGVAVVQAITIKPELYETYRSRPDFIQRYVFPGGMLPTEGHMRDHAAVAGLGFERVETFGHSYAQTLRVWRERFERNWPEIEALGFDARFRRLWLYYLDYCEVGFMRGTVDVGLYRFTKPAAMSSSKSMITSTQGRA